VPCEDHARIVLDDFPRDPGRIADLPIPEIERGICSDVAQFGLSAPEREYAAAAAVKLGLEGSAGSRETC
jgi:hypothetical protein